MTRPARMCAWEILRFENFTRAMSDARGSRRRRLESDGRLWGGDRRKHPDQRGPHHGGLARGFRDDHAEKRTIAAGGTAVTAGLILRDRDGHVISAALVGLYGGTGMTGGAHLRHRRSVMAHPRRRGRMGGRADADPGLDENQHSQDGQKPFHDAQTTRCHRRAPARNRAVFGR